MAKVKKMGAPIEYIPYQNNDNVVVQYELQFGKDLIQPGDRVKIKFDRDVYQFVRLAHHIKHDNTWIDCMSVSRGSWHSFRLERIQRKIKPKRSRVKKVVS